MDILSFVLGLFVGLGITSYTIAMYSMKRIQDRKDKESKLSQFTTTIHAALEKPQDTEAQDAQVLQEISDALDNIEKDDKIAG